MEIDSVPIVQQIVAKNRAQSVQSEATGIDRVLCVSDSRNLKKRPCVRIC